jgi:hypothetical protein
VGRDVHTYLSRQFESPGGGGLIDDHWGNREISTISRDIGFRIPRNRLRPDAAEYYGNANTGDLYEFKHVPGDDIDNPFAIGAGIALALADLPVYEAPLMRAVPGSVWAGGSTWMDGIHDWGPIATVVPGVAGLTDPGDHLLTFADYEDASGALVWASVSPSTKVNDALEAVRTIVQLGLIAGLAIGEAIQNYAYANKAALTIEFMTRINVTAMASADVGAGVAVGTTNSTLSGGAL